MKNIKLNIYVLFSILFIVSACSKDEDENTDEVKPTISGLEIGTSNNHTLYQGGEVHLEFEAADDTELGYYEIHIHKETKSVQTEWEFEKQWHFETGLKNALVHHHEIITPEDADTGAYHFHITLVDKAGNSTSMEEDIQVAEPVGGDGPEIHVEDHPGTGASYQTGNEIVISGHIHGEMAHLAGVLIAIVDESDDLEDTDVSAANSIVMLHTHEFANPEELEFNVSITVGDQEDNNFPDPNPVADWNLHDCYILIKAKDVNENWSFSEHFYMHVME
jgi:hypothetical protein